MEIKYNNIEYSIDLKRNTLIIGARKFVKYLLNEIKESVSENFTNEFELCEVDKNGLMLSNMNILQNMILPLMFHKNINENEAIKIINETADLFGKKINKLVFPESLSKAEKQKLSIIRALALKPKIIIIEEISFLESEKFANIIDLISKTGVILICATELITLADYYKDIIIIKEKL